MSVLSVLKHRAFLTAGCSFIFFWLNRKFLGLMLPEKVRGDSLREWRWLNIANSFTHSFITGIGACYCMIKTPNVWQDLINGHSEVAYYLTSISAGYFLWDFVDMGMNNPKRSTYELLIHHIMVVACFSLTLITNRYQGYAVISLLLEVNSIFLHTRLLVLLSGGKKHGRFYRINGVFNMGREYSPAMGKSTHFFGDFNAGNETAQYIFNGFDSAWMVNSFSLYLNMKLTTTFFLFRIFGLGWLLIWTLRNRQLIGPVAFVIGTISMSGIMVMNFMLLAKVVRSDYFSKSSRGLQVKTDAGSDSEGFVSDDEDRRRSRMLSRSDALSKSVQAVVSATEDVAHLAGLKED